MSYEYFIFVVVVSLHRLASAARFQGRRGTGCGGDCSLAQAECLYLSYRSGGTNKDRLGVPVNTTTVLNFSLIVVVC